MELAIGLWLGAALALVVLSGYFLDEEFDTGIAFATLLWPALLPFAIVALPLYGAWKLGEWLRNRA